VVRWPRRGIAVADPLPQAIRATIPEIRRARICVFPPRGSDEIPCSRLDQASIMNNDSCPRSRSARFAGCSRQTVHFARRCTRDDDTKGQRQRPVEGNAGSPRRLSIRCRSNKDETSSWPRWNPRRTDLGSIFCSECARPLQARSARPRLQSIRRVSHERAAGSPPYVRHSHVMSREVVGGDN